MSFLNDLANTSWGSVWVLFCAHRFGWSPAEMGLQIMAAGVLGIGVQAFLAGRAAKRLGDRTTLLLGVAVGSGALAWAALSPNGGWFVASMPVAALGLLSGPGLQSLLSSSVSPEEQGRVQGAVQALKGLATVVGPPIYGAAFAWSLRQTTGMELSGLPLLVAAGFLAIGFVLALQVRARRAEPADDLAPAC